MEFLQEQRLSIGGMTCEGCVRRVHEVLTALAGVSQVKVTLTPGQATFLASPPALAAAKEALLEDGWELA